MQIAADVALLDARVHGRFTEIRTDPPLPPGDPPMRTARTFRNLLTAAALAAPVSLASRDALACGGFFCSSSPVDQTAEHILFRINDDETVTAIVQIQYTGDRDQFAWIVPVPGNPKLDASFPNLALRALDQATQPQYFKQSCRGAALEDAVGGAPPPSAAGGGVTVVASQVVGPFETVTLNAASADVLVEWLQAHDYRITEKMVPLLQPYVADGLNFVAVRLQADEQVEDIEPLSMTYAGDRPFIPIRLTAIAAQPEMGVVAWVLDDRRWAPDNYVDLKIPDSLVEFDQFGYQSNYLTVVSREADRVGGQAFVTEYAGPTAPLVQQIESQGVPQGNPDAAEAQAALLEVLRAHPKLTRLYARMSAEEMIDDPFFKVAADQGEVSNVHDLTEPGFDYSKCASVPAPDPTDPCAFTYCGREGACIATDVTTNGSTATVAACVCRNTATARTTMTGFAAAAYCEPVAMNLDSASVGGAGPAYVAACEAMDCGVHGACVAMNGNPSCQCEAGYGAVTTTTYDAATGAPTNRMSCEKVPEGLLSFPVVPRPGQVSLPPSAGAASDDGGCSVGVSGRRAGAGGSGAALLAGLGALVARARRRGARRARFAR